MLLLWLDNFTNIDHAEWKGELNKNENNVQGSNLNSRDFILVETVLFS